MFLHSALSNCKRHWLHLIRPYSKEAILCFHSCGQHLCKFIGTKESVYRKKRVQHPHRTGLGHKHGRRFIVLGHKYGRYDVMWKHTIGTLSLSCKKKNEHSFTAENNGESEYRSQYLSHAKRALYHLNYNPPVLANMGENLSNHKCHTITPHLTRKPE